MTDNTQLNPGQGGDTVRALDRGSSKTQVMAIDVGGVAGEQLLSSANPLPAALPYLLPGALAANAVLDARLMPDVEFQFTTGTVQVTRSLNGTDYVPWDASGKKADGTTVDPTSAALLPGIYSTDGSAWLKFSAAVVVRGGA
jgi:hypothetical protein